MNSMNWDDLKFFLAVCRMGSIRAAAKLLDVNHATVSRRINSFEDALNQRLFDRTPRGYLKTKAAEEIYAEASHLEERLNLVERKVAGKDQSLCGEIRVTLADVLAQRLFMDDFAEFAHQYPDINLEIIDSARSFNLTNREADVALRISNEPPEHLIGRKLANVHRACYISKRWQNEIKNDDWLAKQNWIGWSDKMRRPIGKIARDYPKFDSKHSIVSAVLQAEACRHGMGIAVLPCFMGDIDERLIRIPPYSSEKKFELWLLSHPDLRKNTKVQTFVRFITQRMNAKKALIEGQRYSFIAQRDTFN
ncbi:LysR family transcriptional regulator [Aliiglaciecola sp. M165]|nr:LysR family transcriptional regulator [Aliiglaciecola sp. M165]